MNTRKRLAVDRTVELQINGSRQRIRLRSRALGLPPLLIVQGGPALPILHEVRKFERQLNLEALALVCYWEQRGCGNASATDAKSVSMARQVEDLRSVLQWLHAETHQPVVILGISIGGTFALQAAEHELEATCAVIAISPDSKTRVSDASSYSFLEEQARRDNRLARKTTKLGPPPYLKLTAFQRRASLLADLGTIEHGKRFAALLRETLVEMFRTYGLLGTARAFRNMNLILRQLLPEIDTLDLLANPPRVSVPVHYVFGENDVLTPASLAHALPTAIAAASTTVVRVPGAGHMVHFDHPEIVHSLVTMETRRAASRLRHDVT